jgi:hypothetical protein
VYQRDMPPIMEGMNVKTDLTMRMMIRLCSDNREADDRHAARIEDLEEFVWRGDYRVASRDIVEAILTTGPRFETAPIPRRPERKTTRLTRCVSQF